MREERRKKRRRKFFAKLVFFLLLFLGAGMASAAMNYKNIKSVVNSFVPSKIANAVQENGEENTQAESASELAWSAVCEDSEIIRYTAKKEVKILNVDISEENNVDAFIRVCILPRWVCTVTAEEASAETETASGGTGVSVDVTNHDCFKEFGALTSIEIAENGYTMGDVSFHLADGWETDWFYNPNDGYFYYRAKVAPGEATEPLLDSISIPAELGAAMQEEGVDLQVDILSDSIQAVGGAADARWKDAGISIDEANGTLAPASQEDKPALEGGAEDGDG